MKKNTPLILFFAVVVSLIVGFVAGKGMSNEENKKSTHSMDSQMEDMKHSLMDKKGDEFDKAFLDEMIVHHEGALLMANQVLATSTRPELLELADEIIKAQTEEINKMKEWRSVWFK